MTLNEIFKQIVDIIGEFDRTVSGIEPILEEERLGDVRHSLADISLAKKYLNYEPRLDTRRLSLTVQFIYLKSDYTRVINDCGFFEQGDVPRFSFTVEEGDKVIPVKVQMGGRLY